MVVLGRLDQISDILLHPTANHIKGQVVRIPSKGVLNFNADLLDANR